MINNHQWSAMVDCSVALQTFPSQMWRVGPSENHHRAQKIWSRISCWKLTDMVFFVRSIFRIFEDLWNFAQLLSSQTCLTHIFPSDCMDGEAGQPSSWHIPTAKRCARKLPNIMPPPCTHSSNGRSFWSQSVGRWKSTWDPVHRGTIGWQWGFTPIIFLVVYDFRGWNLDFWDLTFMLREKNWEWTSSLKPVGINRNKIKPCLNIIESSHSQEQERSSGRVVCFF